MSIKQYVVKLSEGERATLMAVIKAKRVSAQKRQRAQILLMVDEGEFGAKWTDAQAAEAYHCGINQPAALRKRLVEQGFEAALERKAQVRPSRAPKLDDAAQRELIALAKSPPPDGRVRWTLQLLANRLVQLQLVEDSICLETVRQALKKTSSRRTGKWRG